MDYIMKLLMAVISRLKALTLNPIRNFLRKLQMMFNTNVIANKILGPITKKFRELFHIAPKSGQDYYTVGKLLIAKKLVAAVIVGACILVFAYFNFIAEPVEQPVTTTTGIVTNVYFDYDDMDLAEYTGKANIRATNGSVVYTGDIVNGMCTGTGTLYNQSSVLVYQGEFAENEYSGSGTLYYPDGTVRYEGTFAENDFDGEGILYYSSGQIEYKGEFSKGFYNGKGVSYAENGSLIYEGSYLNGQYHENGVLYHENGMKKYEGEFFLGVPQGEGTLYTGAGRPYYTGIVADGDVAYESLISLSLEDVTAMFYDEPEVYYTYDCGSCFVYETAQVILKTDCIVRIVSRDLTQEDENPAAQEGNGWYLPEGVGDGLKLDTTAEPVVDTTAEEDSGETEEEESELSMAEALLMAALNMETEDSDKPTDYVTKENKIYYFINDSEWVSEEDLALKSVMVNGISVYKEDLKSPITEDEVYIPVNGATDLADCIAISYIRKRTPTTFGNITFEELNKGHRYSQANQEQTSYRYSYIKNINYAEAIYKEMIDREDFSYELCYQADDADHLLYYSIKAAQ
ncbi:MAG: hypothetical protein IJ390_09385 [Lachnospiraceae bacterium]|nr:hypothetical protein [Lachnospiraceae bacterium]